ncbi:kalirin-like [Micropterus dolomieu]|uniref:kalirin-like n=1 Tax=Micropterus dolomieu TaxID=147949 RepID=UPI001E8EB6FC|nr:kalirin-like [Micropterus dolomieu]
MIERGSGKAECVRAVDVLTVLREKVAFVSGGRDKRGGPILTFPARTNHDRIKQEDLSRLVTYLATIPSEDVRARGFTVVVDMRGSKWDSVKPVLRTLQESFSSNIHTALLIKPDTFWQKHKTNLGSAKLSFEKHSAASDGVVSEQLRLTLVWQHFWSRSRESSLYGSEGSGPQTQSPSQSATSPTVYGVGGAPGGAVGSPGSKRSVSGTGNTLKRWLTSPVRRLSQGKADGQKKPPIRTRRRDNRPEQTTPLTGNAQTEEAGQSGGEEEPEEESHTLLPPPMQIIKDPNNPEEISPDFGKRFRVICFNTPPSLCLQALDSDQGSNESDTEQRNKALRGRMFVVNEMIQSEKDYVKDLAVIVEGFMSRLEVRGIPEDMRGKDKIVFGNIQQIYDWHRDFFLVELDRCVQNHDLLADLFIRHERRLHMYVVYCQNKPRSEFIVIEYETFFEEIQHEISCRMSISDYLIKPIQRITKYQLLLKDFLKYTSKAGLDCEEIEKAVELMSLVPKRCNDMMNLGRLQGYEGKLTSQGKLLQQETFCVWEQDGGVLSRSKERRVFLFEQIIIFSELLRKGSNNPGYQFKNSIKVTYLAMQDSVDGDPCKFVLWSRGSAERFTLQASSASIKMTWVENIATLLDAQNNFLSALQSPIEYQKKEGGISVTRPLSSGRPPSAPPTPNGHATQPPPDVEQDDQELVLVTQDFVAVREDEICVFRGEKVQILASNQQGQSLVYRPANSDSPAAEGWVSRSVLKTH